MRCSFLHCMEACLCRASRRISKAALPLRTVRTTAGLPGGRLSARCLPQSLVHLVFGRLCHLVDPVLRLLGRASRLLAWQLPGRVSFGRNGHRTCRRRVILQVRLVVLHACDAGARGTPSPCGGTVLEHTRFRPDDLAAYMRSSARASSALVGSSFDPTSASDATPMLAVTWTIPPRALMSRPPMARKTRSASRRASFAPSPPQSRRTRRRRIAPGHRPPGAPARRDSRSCTCAIASHVPEAIVDLLQVVDVEHQYRDVATCAARASTTAAMMQSFMYARLKACVSGSRTDCS